ncbi:MAG: hypothetical protein AAF443_00410 [Chlamydiota bacterium]
MNKILDINMHTLFSKPFLIKFGHSIDEYFKKPNALISNKIFYFIPFIFSYITTLASKNEGYGKNIKSLVESEITQTENSLIQYKENVFTAATEAKVSLLGQLDKGEYMGFKLTDDSIQFLESETSGKDITKFSDFLTEFNSIVKSINQQAETNYFQTGLTETQNNRRKSRAIKLKKNLDDIENAPKKAFSDYIQQIKICKIINYYL